MYEKLNKEIQKILEIVKQCPEKFQEKCFELLLSNFLESEKKVTIPEKVKEKKLDVTPIKEKVEEEYIHVKVKAFLQKYGLSIDQLGKLFLIEEHLVEPIYKIKTVKMAKSQIQLSLLEALKEAIKSGNFRFEIEGIRSLCKDKKFYDSANFSATFNNNKDLFKNETFKKGEPLELSEEGMKELADTINELITKAKE